jgi:regulator of Ty1 transposition protein 103
MVIACILIALFLCVQEYKERLKQVETIQKELKSHIQSLPDMSLLPAVTGGLAPLPSAGDLFNIDQALGID